MDVAAAASMLRGARRIAVVGNGGSGKSTFARRIAALLDLPLTHLDQAFWKPGWVETPREEWLARHGELIAADAWVLDGNYGGTQAERFATADVVVFLDLAPWRCVASAVWRSTKHYGRTRPDLAPGCPERIDRKFLLWIWNFNTTSRPTLVARLHAHPPTKGVIHLPTRHTMTTLLHHLTNDPTNDQLPNERGRLRGSGEAAP